MPQLAFAFADFEMSNDGIPEDEMDLAVELAELWANPDADSEEYEDELIHVFATDTPDVD